MGFLDGLELFKFGVLYHRPISTSFNARLSFGNWFSAPLVSAPSYMFTLFDYKFYVLVTFYTFNEDIKKCNVNTNSNPLR